MRPWSIQGRILQKGGSSTMIKVGAITIGQSPRTDVTQDILPLLGDQVELLQEIGRASCRERV